MPDEPEKNIEPALNAYRDQRRDAAGAMPLHPATRQMLQGEVARTFGAKAVQPARTEPIFSGFWTRLAVGTGFCAMAAFVILQLQNGGPQKQSITLSDAPREADSKEKSLQLAYAPDTKPGAPATAIPELKLKLEREEIAAGESLARNKTVIEKLDRKFTTVAEPAGAVPAISMARSDALAPAVAGGGGAATGESPRPLTRQTSENRSDFVKLGEAPNPSKGIEDIASRRFGGARPLVGGDGPASDLKSFGSASPKPAESKAATPAARPSPSRSEDAPVAALALSPRAITTARGATAAESLGSPQPISEKDKVAVNFFKRGSVENSARYQQVNPREDLRRNFQSPALPAVLTTFQLDLDGDKVRITDADGSTYEGRLQAGDALGLIVANPVADGLVRNEPEVLKAIKTLGKKEILDELAKRPAQLSELSAAQDQLADRDSGATSYGFVVNGINRKLNLAVEFRGNFVVEPPTISRPRVLPALEQQKSQLQQTTPIRALRGAMPATPAFSNPDSAAKQPTVSNAAAVSNQFNYANPSQLPAGSVIRGRAVVGGKDAFEIRAVPATKP